MASKTNKRGSVTALKPSVSDIQEAILHAAASGSVETNVVSSVVTSEHQSEAAVRGHIADLIGAGKLVRHTHGRMRVTLLSRSIGA